MSTTADKFHAIYLYYFTKEGGLRIYEWWDPVDDIGNQNSVKTRIFSLITNAYDEGDSPEYYTDDPELMIMRRKSYIVFAASVEYWKNSSSGTIEANGKNHLGDEIDGYHTFFNPRPLADPTNKHLVFYCENRMMSSIPDMGSPTDPVKLRKKEVETFSFKMLFEPKVLLHAEGDDLRPTDEDPGGTNMGPPVPPPAGGLYPPFRPKAA